MPFGRIRSAFNKVRNFTTGRSSGSPANTPNAASNNFGLDTTQLTDEQLAQLQSAQIIETLISLFSPVQENNRLEISEDRSPSSKYDNVLKTSNLLATQAQFVDSVVTPINGLYGIVLRSTTFLTISEEDVDGNTLPENLANIAGSAWSAIVDAANGIAEAFDSDEAAKSLDVLKFPEYYVFIFANTSPESPIPVLLPVTENSNDDFAALEYENITAYPKAIITNSAIRELDTLDPGTMIRVEYDGVDNKSVPVIVEIVENKPEFTRMVVNSMKNRGAFLSSEACSTDSVLGGVNHATGDPIGVSDQPDDEELLQSDQPDDEELQQSEQV
jgi:hypothetical protein